MDERGRALERAGRTPAPVRHQGRRAAYLSVAVGGTLGGLLLLGSNLAAVLSAGSGAVSPAPLIANAALIFGGVMCAREFRRAGREPHLPG